MLLAELFEPNNHPLFLLGSDHQPDQERACQLIDRLLLDPVWLRRWCLYQRAVKVCASAPHASTDDAQEATGRNASVADDELSADDERGSGSLAREVQEAIVERGVFASYLEKKVARQDLEKLLGNLELLGELQERIVDPGRAKRQKLLHAFRDDLMECKDTWEVVRLLLHEYGKPLGIFNVRYHRFDRTSNMLVLTASAGHACESEFEEELRARGRTKHCRFLDLEKWDSLWPFKNEEPTLFQVKEDAQLPLMSARGPHGIHTVFVPKEQCKHIERFKGPARVDFPFMVRRRWSGKLSCDIDSADINRPAFYDNVTTFWELTKAAGVCLELYAIEEGGVPFRVLGAGSGRSRTTAGAGLSDPGLPHVCPRTDQSHQIYEADKEYEATHGELENAAIAAYVTQLLRCYRRENMAIDGGRTNTAIADALVHDIEDGYLSVRTIMTNNLGLPFLIPDGDPFPLLELSGGRVRRKKAQLGDVVGDEAVIKRIRSWRFAVSVIGADGFNPPDLFTGTGQDYDTKRAFMRSSSDVIVPLPSYKWGRISGRSYLNVQKGYSQIKNIYLVTVYPHEDAKDPSLRGRALAFLDHLLAGTRAMEQYGTGVRLYYAVARFFPDSGLYPTLEHIGPPVLEAMFPASQISAQGLVPLGDLYKHINPDRHSDVRMIVCIQLPVQELRGIGSREELRGRAWPRAADDTLTSQPDCGTGKRSGTT